MIKESGRIQWDITWQRLAQYAKLAMPTRKRPGGRTDAADMVRTNAHNGAVES